MLGRLVMYMLRDVSGADLPDPDRGTDLTVLPQFV